MKQCLQMKIILLVCFKGSLWANTYLDSAGDHLWKNQANWSDGIPFISTNEADNTYRWADMTVDGALCLIDSNHTGINKAQACGVYPGCYGGDSDLQMTGGELECWYLNIGRGNPDSGSDGYLKITGGLITASGELKIPNQFNGDSGNICGHLDLWGGTIKVTSGTFLMGSRISGVYGGGIGTMDIRGGTLLIKGDKRALIEQYKNNGWITVYSGDSSGRLILDYNTINPGFTTVTAQSSSILTKALDPEPANQAVDISRSPVLKWKAGQGAVTHQVYLGDDFNQVNNANNPNVQPGRGEITSPSFIGANLLPGKSYYWRVDEVNTQNPLSPLRGDIWMFTTLNPVTGDVDRDMDVDWDDLLGLAARWLKADCEISDWCDGADLNKSQQVDMSDYAIFASNMPTGNHILPPYTDYCAMLSQEIQGKKHAFMAGNRIYYIGGQYTLWHKQEDETLGLTHPFFHDLRSRGFGMVQDSVTGYGHDLQGWEFYRDTRIAYGTVIVNGVSYINPVPLKMYWRPDRIVCEYSTGGVSVHEEKFISLNDVACSIITSSAPIQILFRGQSYVNNARSRQRTSTCVYDNANNAVHITEGGTILVRPQEGIDIEGKPMYDGMHTVVSASRDFQDTYEAYRDGNGRQQYSFFVPCDANGLSIYWAMDDVYAAAASKIQQVKAHPAAYRNEKTAHFNNLLNYQIPYFRCSDPDIVQIYYYLWSIYLMYYTDIKQGWEIYPHTQTAVNNFLGMHRFDANFQIKVGQWMANKPYYAYGNVLVWKSLLPYARIGGQLPDNMGISWFSPYWESAIEHVVGAWEIYQHSGDITFAKECYESYFKPLFWDAIYDVWGAKYDGAECLKKFALVTGHPQDAAHWHQVGDLDGLNVWLQDMWQKQGIANWFGGKVNAVYPLGTSEQTMDWTGMAYMRNNYFPQDWASLMTQHWAIDSVKGFWGTIPLTHMALQDWDHAFPDFASTPDASYMSIIGMYKHYVGNNANICALQHLKKYNHKWGIPVAPESYDKNFNIWGDQYSNFNAGKILLIMALTGVDYSIPEDTFTVCDSLPQEWSYFQVMVPFEKYGRTQWINVQVHRQPYVNGTVQKSVTVEGNPQSKLYVQPWLEEKTILNAPAGYTSQPRGHISYEYDNAVNQNLVIQMHND